MNKSNRDEFIDKRFNLFQVDRENGDTYDHSVRKLLAAGYDAGYLAAQEEAQMLVETLELYAKFPNAGLAAVNVLEKYKRASE